MTIATGRATIDRSVRIASYNILDGGEGRADPLAEVLLAQRSDVIAIVEADNAEVLARLAERLKMDYVHAVGDGHGVALFTRWRMTETINHALLRSGGPRSFLQADLIDPAGRTLTCGVLHLHPRADDSDEQQREKELAVVLEVFAPHRRDKQAHLLMGDFNANSPVQLIDPEKTKKSTRESWKKNGGMIPRRAIQMMLDHGYLDTLHAARPAAAQTDGTFTTQHPEQRVDYIFAWGIEPQRVKDAWIEHDRLAKYASDHFPVGCEIVD